MTISASEGGVTGDEAADVLPGAVVTGGLFCHATLELIEHRYRAPDSATSPCGCNLSVRGVVDSGDVNPWKE
jgi:hypothetical protein